jgi:hypothetical protein
VIGTQNGRTPISDTATVIRERTVPLLRAGTWYDSLDVVPPAAPGLAAVGQAPEAMIRADARRLRKNVKTPVPRRSARARMLRAALELFAEGTVSCGGQPQDAGEFRAELWATAGLPAVLVDRWCALLHDQLDRLCAAPPGPGRSPAAPAAEAAERPPPTLVALPGNTFTCLASVFEAALSGTPVWVRPSTREPISALRLVSALIDAGWPADLLGFYPSSQDALTALADVTGHQIIFGGAEVCARFAGRPNATMNGPMRVCALIPADADPAQAADQLLPLIGGDGGRFCTAVRTVLCPGGADQLTEQLAGLLDAVPLVPADPQLPLAAWPDRDRAAALEAAIGARLRPGDAKATRRPILAEAGGAAYLTPTLLRLAPARPGDPPAWGRPALLGFEAPFPLASVVAVDDRRAAALAAGADLVHRLPRRAGEGGAR